MPRLKASAKAKKTKAALPKKKRSLAKRVTQKKTPKTKRRVNTKVKKKVLAIPKGFHTITAYLIVDGAAGAVEFYKKALGAKQIFRMDQPNGKVGHAELKIGDSKIMLGDEVHEMH